MIWRAVARNCYVAYCKSSSSRLAVNEPPSQYCQHLLPQLVRASARFGQLQQPRLTFLQSRIQALQRALTFFLIRRQENLSAQSGLRDGEDQFSFGAAGADQMRFA